MSGARQSHLSQQQIRQNNFWIFCSRTFALNTYKFELVSYHCQSMSYKLRPVSYHLCQGYEELYLVEKPPCKEKPLKALTSDAVEICARSHTHYTLIIVQLKLSTNVSQNLAALCFAATTPAGKGSSTSVWCDLNKLAKYLTKILSAVWPNNRHEWGRPFSTNITVYNLYSS